MNKLCKNILKYYFSCIFSASKLERDRIDHERLQQRRIDESITAALAEKCIILDEVEEVIDEFPPLSEKQDRFVNFALHGPKDHVSYINFFRR